MHKMKIGGNRRVGLGGGGPLRFSNIKLERVAR